MGRLVTVEQAKAFVGVSSSSADSVVTTILDGIEAWIQEELRLTLTSQEGVIERCDGGLECLYLDTRPVTSITEVYDILGEEVIATDEYYLAQYGVMMEPAINDRWPRGRDRYRVTYTGGLTSTVITDSYAGLRLAVLELIYRTYENRGGKSGGSSKSQSTNWQQFLDTDIERKIRAFSMKGIL